MVLCGVRIPSPSITLPLSRQTLDAHYACCQRASAARERRRPAKPSLMPAILSYWSVPSCLIFPVVAPSGEDGAAAPPASRSGVFAVSVTLQKLSQNETQETEIPPAGCHFMNRSVLSVCPDYGLVSEQTIVRLFERSPSLSKKRTPIERFIEEGTLEDRRARWEEHQRQKGLYRVCVRCHVDDREKVKEFAASLLSARLSTTEGNEP